jgi:hypothetical protein
MKTIVLAAFGVLALGVSAASAQGTAGATAPVYGQKWAETYRAEHSNATARASQPTHTTAPEKAAREQPSHPNRG